MLDKDVLTRDTIRMLISEIKRFEIDNKAEAGEETILSIIQKMVKQRNDSIEQFQKGGRKDLADKEISQLEIIKKYICLLYTSPSPRDLAQSRMPSSA